MMACHVSRVCGADLLVCDRTFCSLDAVAERLLGAWAGLGLKLVCRWDTDVVADFLAAKCARIVLQDPADEIISHCSSLKCGVATSVMMKDSEWTRLDLSWHYLSAEFKREEQVRLLLNELNRILSIIPFVLLKVPPMLNSENIKAEIPSIFNEQFLEVSRDK